MKKVIFILIFLAVISPVFSQQNNKNTETDLYYLNVKIEKIYQCSQGYVILYRRGTNQLGTVSVPNEWFTEAGGKAEMMRLPAGRDWPTMSIFYKAGEFSHVRIYVHRNRGHRSWALFSGAVDTRPFFEEEYNIVNIKY